MLKNLLIQNCLNLQSLVFKKFTKYSGHFLFQGRCGLTPDDVDHDPVWRGVGGYAGVVAAQPGGGVSHCQPALRD